ncbi:MAG: hypothetical protein JXI43_06650 [Tissierellales bacterium]|nr:hypothetical protein [Tissierellales bacterium]
MYKKISNPKKVKRVNNKKSVIRAINKRSFSWDHFLLKACPIVLSFLAVAISYTSLLVSIKQTTIQEEYLKVNISFKANENNTSNVLLFPIDDPLYDFSSYVEGLPYIKGFLVFDVDLEIANLSLRKVSISDISAYPVFRNTDPDILSNWIPVFSSFIFTGIQVSDSLSTVKNGINDKVSLPISLDSGESITINSKISWPLDDDMVNLIKNYLTINNDATLGDIKDLLIQSETHLGMGSIEMHMFNETSIPSYLSAEESNLLYYFALYSSFGTEHDFYLDVKPQLQDLMIN